MCGPYWAVLRMYGSHDMRHIDFPRVDSGQRDTPVLGRHKTFLASLHDLQSLAP